MPLAPSLDTVGWFAKDIDVYEGVGKVCCSSRYPHPARAALHPCTTDAFAASEALGAGPSPWGRAKRCNLQSIDTLDDSFFPKPSPNTTA